ncbi:MAG: hypothetical protein K2L51_06395, partial [Clostridiales bacterium]|nr:hypothetical protein [Clostridiales bacterium]
MVQSQSVFGNANDKANVDKSGEIIKPKKNYLYGQQRFFTEDISPTNGTGYFFEDTKGLLIAKNKVRSVGELTLTVRLSVWVPDAANGGYKKDPQYEPIAVSVPLYVGNTDLTLSTNSRTYNVTTSAKMASGATVALTTNYDADYPKGAPEGTTAVRSDPNDDQWNATYREDMYFLSSSIEGYKSYASPHSADTSSYNTRTATNMTEDELKHIQSVYATTTDSDLKARIRAYFGVATDADVAGITIASANGTNALTKANGDALDINPYYANYFTVSPTRADSKSITIMPNRITTFTPKGGTRTAIEAEAAMRGLKVAWSNANGGENDIAYNYFYYPLKLIVYDRLTVGYSANTTRFAETDPNSLDDTSLDVITLNVRVTNAAPQVVTRNMSDTVTVRENGVAVDYAGKRISLAKGNRVVYNFTDLFSDADMVIDTTGSYLQEAGVKGTQSNPKTGIDADTGDYPHDWKDASATAARLAKVEFLTATSASGNTATNEYDASNKTGAVNCTLSDTGITVQVMNRAAGFKPSDVAAYIKLTFQDSHGEQATCVIAVYIANAAPTLTSQAQATRNITMYTGDYFYMYATTFEDFITGANISETVGNEKNGTYDGTYFDSNNVPTTSSKTISGGVDQWSYHEGIRQPDGSFKPSSPNVIPNNIISGSTQAGNGTLRNLGYLAIAEDDAPWTLRFRTQGAVECSSDMISVTTMNAMLYEGSKKVTSNEVWGDTAVLFRARGAVKDATVTITLYDGDSAIDGSENVNTLVYTFKITVESTIPVPITQENQSADRVLGKYLDSSMQGRLSHIANEQDNTR